MKKRAAKINLTKNDLAASFILKEINNRLKKFLKLPKRTKRADPLDILIATILSQNTSDLNSFKAYLNLQSYFKSWGNIENAKLSHLTKLISVAGLGNKKARVIKDLIKRLKQEHGSVSLKKIQTLNDEDALKYLTSFKGVGLKTAACVLLFSFNRDICPVDTHVHRILNRVGVIKQKDTNKTFYELNRIIPHGLAYELHTHLILFGRFICLSKKPKCNNCPLLDICKYDKKNMNSENYQNNRLNDFLLLANT